MSSRKTFIAAFLSDFDALDSSSIILPGAGYGTLLDPKILARFAGRALELISAVLPGWRRVYLRGTPHSTPRPARNQVIGAAGSVDSATLRRLSAYEGSGYRLTPVTIDVAGGSVAAYAWLADAATARLCHEEDMPQPPPAQPGMREDEVDTPALLIDLDAFEYNLDRVECLWPVAARGGMV